MALVPSVPTLIPQNSILMLFHRTPSQIQNILSDLDLDVGYLILFVLVDVCIGTFALLEEADYGGQILLVFDVELPCEVGGLYGMC